jgi:Mg2+ and Co2+ transporter CorA
MNVKVPGQGFREAFYIVIAFMFIVLVALLTLFRRRGWL